MDPSEGSHATLLREVGVRLIAEDDFIAPAAMGKKADEVRHGAAWNKKRSLFAKALCGQPLEPVYRRVLAENIIAYFCFSHGSAHSWRRPGNRIGSQINHAHALSPGSKSSGLRVAGCGLKEQRGLFMSLPVSRRGMRSC
jgi:hypothetical protein